MNKFQNALYRFMSGRYGSDQLNNFLLIFALILLILNLFVIRNPYLATIIWIILIINIFLVIFIKGELKMINFYL